MNAPLNSRVPIQVASATRGKGKAKAEPLEKAPLEVQEALILEDLLFVLMVRLVGYVVPHMLIPTSGHRRDLHHLSHGLHGRG